MIPDIEELTRLHTSRRRDDFACAAMAAMIPGSNTGGDESKVPILLATIAQLSYRMADAMLAERDK